MRDSNGNLLGSTKFKWMGMGAGGWVTGIDIADDGTMVTRNDTHGAHIRGSNDSTWADLFRIGDTYSESLYVFKNPAGWCYDVCLAPTNSNVIYAAGLGRLWKSTNRGAAMVALNGYKTGALDETLSFAPVGAARIGGQHMRVDPAGTNVVGFGHPVDGLYYTLDGGDTWTKNTSIPAPVSKIGICLIFDRGSAAAGGQTQTVYCVVDGRGTYVSTTGISGSFTKITGGPTVASSLAVISGKLHVVGTGVDDNALLSVWDGTNWSNPSATDRFNYPVPVTGFAVTVRPNAPGTAVVVAIDGRIFVTRDGGVTWKLDVVPGFVQRVAHDIPWLAVTMNDWLALGSAQFHPSQDRLIITNGIGVWYIDQATGAAPNPDARWTSISKGIEQLLPMNISVAPNNRVHITVEDRVVFSFDKDAPGKDASQHGPNYNASIRHGNGIDYAIDNPNYVVVTYEGTGSVGRSRDGGRTWGAFASLPTFSHPQEGVVPFANGDIAVGNAGNVVWVSYSNGGVATTLNDGQSWVTPNFGGTSMTGAFWYNAYYMKRRILSAEKSNPGTFYLYCVGTGNDDAADRAMRGLWKSADGGLNFSRIRASLFTTFSQDFYHCKLKLVPTKPNHLVWVVGDQNGYPTPPSPTLISFSNDDGATIMLMQGFAECNDITFGAPAPGANYPAIYVVGWRSNEYGLWRCVNFNPATAAGTWTLLSKWPMGRDDLNCVIAADMSKFGRVYYGVAGGGALYADYEYNMVISAS